MTTHARSVFFFILSLVIAAAAFAAKPISDPPATADMTVSASAIQWAPTGTFERTQLVVSGPGEFSYTRDFPAGATPSLQVRDLGKMVADGQYTWELRIIPRISAETREKLADARSRDDDAGIARIKAEAGLDRDLSVSGGFTVLNGAFVSNKAEEPPPAAASTPAAGKQVSGEALKVGAETLVTAQDEVIQGSLCVGLDCTTTETFGFDTIKLKENNTRIHFNDTSTSAGFPNVNWQLTANDSNSGGQNKFSIDDLTNSKTPFTVTAAAPTNSLFIASSGKVGFGNNSPGLNLHITATDTPAIRQEQTSGGGFTAQTWDIGANEANWFVRDLTGGSRLPFRIRPGAPTSSIDISASGQVGVGTASPATVGSYYMPLQVASSNQLGSFIRISNSDSTYEMLGTWMPNNALTAGWLVGVNNTGNMTLGYGSSGTEDGALTAAKDNGTGVTIATTSGNVGLKCTSPTAQLVIASGSGCSTPTSSINAGSSAFTTTSSRTFKENIAPVEANNILEKIENVPVVTYDFKNNGPKDRMGLIAEDFYTVFHRGDDKHIDGQDVQMALWLAVQQLTAQNKQLTERINSLEKQLSTQQPTTQQ